MFDSFGLNTVGWPSSLPVPKLDGGGGASFVLNVAICLLKVIKVGGTCIGDVLRLPVAERVDEPFAMSIDRDHLYRGRNRSYISFTPPVIKTSAVPSWNLFQLSAVPTF